MSSGEYSTTQETMVLPLLQQKNIIGRPFITVSGIGRQTNTSTYLNGGADFGPDTLSGATDLGQYGPPYSTSLGAAEAKTYGNKYNKAVYYVTSQTFSFLESLYNILNGDIVKATVTVGTNPYGVAITPDGNYAYVTNYGSGTVSVIDISTNTVTTTVTVGTNPVGVAITPDGNYAYVTNNGSGTVSVIDTSLNTISTTVTVGSYPYAVAITPDSSYVYIANSGSGTVSVIEISSNTVTTTVTVGTDPYAVAITPDGNYAYVTNNSPGTVSVIEISTNTVTTTVTVGTNPVGVTITPDGNYAYVTNNGTTTVSVIQINSVVNSWHGIKGIIPLNRIYNQDLTAQTNDTTTLATASTISITPSFSGRVKIKAILRGSNDTLSDGIKVALYNGSTSIDSETYTQEGLASNEHTFALSYDSLSSALTIGTAYSFTVQFAAVTGGTASLKVIEFSAEEY